MQRMFICYRRDDSKSVSSRIYDRLAAEFGKPNVFKDVNVIPAGVDFRDYLQKEIAKTDTVLVIIGTRWSSILQDRVTDPTDYVRIEIESAIQQNKRIIPVLVEGAKPPAADVLPDSIQRLAYLHTACVDDDPDFHPDMNKLVALLRQTTAARPRLPGRLLIALVVLGVVVLGSLVALQAMSAGNNTFNAAQNATATVRALPTLSLDAPTISSLGGMWLYQEPIENGMIIGSVTDSVPIIGRSADSAYVLVQAASGRGWIRLNRFMQVSTSLDGLTVVSFTAPTPTPAPDASATPRPSPTPRPTSEFAEGWLVNASANFSSGLPSGWSVTDPSIVTSLPNAPMTLIGQGLATDMLRRSGYFANSGTRTLFSLTGDSSGFFETRIFLSQGVASEAGYRYFGLEPIAGTDWQLVSAFDGRDPITAREFRLLPDRVYDLTLLLEGNNTFFVTLIDQESGVRLIDAERFPMNTIWNAKVGDPIYFAINPLAGATFVQRVDTLLLAR